MIDYRDPRNGSIIDNRLSRIYASCVDLVDQLKRLDDVLAPDVELTPKQAQDLADALGAAGVLGGAILTRDLERTARREDRA
jgi:hypothetical protein